MNVSLFTGGNRDVAFTTYNARYSNVGMNMRRLERMVEPPEPFVAALSLLGRREKPLPMHNIVSGVLNSVSGIYERGSDEPVLIPDGYRLACIAQLDRGFLITIGPDFVNAIKKANAGSPTPAFYEETFRKHPGDNKRAPIIVRIAS
jgi:hypothetical protein